MPLQARNTFQVWITRATGTAASLIWLNISAKFAFEELGPRNDIVRLTGGTFYAMWLVVPYSCTDVKCYAYTVPPLHAAPHHQTHNPSLRARKPQAKVSLKLFVIPIDYFETAIIQGQNLCFADFTCQTYFLLLRYHPSIVTCTLI